MSATWEPGTGTDIDESADLPAAFALQGNHPNPFNPATTIRYDVHRPGHVTLAIYSLLGQRVRTLVDAVRPAGEHDVVWHGHNDAGEGMASGVYLVRMQVEEAVQSRPLLLVK